MTILFNSAPHYRAKWNRSPFSYMDNIANCRPWANYDIIINPCIARYANAIWHKYSLTDLHSMWYITQTAYFAVFLYLRILIGKGSSFNTCITSHFNPISKNHSTHLFCHDYTIFKYLVIKSRISYHCATSYYYVIFNDRIFLYIHKILNSYIVSYPYVLFCYGRKFWYSAIIANQGFIFFPTIPSFWCKIIMNFIKFKPWILCYINTFT